MRADFFRVETQDGRRTLAIAVVCLQQRYCGVLWRGGRTVVKEVRDLDAWEAAAKELVRTDPPPAGGAVARLILDPSLDPLALRPVLLDAVYVRRSMSLSEWEDMLRGRAPGDDADDCGLAEECEDYVSPPAD